MRLFPLLFVLLAARAGAALTITLSPSTANPGLTRIEIHQDSTSPVFSVDQVTVGSLPGVGLSGQSVLLTAPLDGQVIQLASSAGQVSDSSGFSSSLTALSFYGLIPSLNFASPLSVAPGSSHQLTFQSNGPVEVNVDFAYFAPGTYSSSSVIFGQVTTVVVPEPATLSLAGALAGLALLRRRRA